MNKFESWHQEQENKIKARQEAAARERRQRRTAARTTRPARVEEAPKQDEQPAAE
jgi:hypothetical protein